MKRSIFTALAVLCLSWNVAASLADGPLTGNEGRPKVVPDFAKTGVQPSRPFPNLKLTTVDGKPARLAGSWRKRPTLLVASSLTCPVSRDNCAPVDAIASKFGDKLNVVVIYTLEAHPNNAPSPYSGKLWLTERNVRDQVLIPAAADLKVRTASAEKYLKLKNIRSRMLIDSMDNAAWKALGGGPNSAALIDTDGKVVFRHGWLNVVQMRHEIQHRFDMQRSEAAIAAAIAKGTATNKPFLNGDFQKALRDSNLKAVEQYLNDVPELVHWRGGHMGRSEFKASALHQAERQNDLKLARLLLARGVPVEAIDRKGETVLHSAAQRGRDDFVKLLLEHHADADALSSERLSPLHAAVFHGHKKTAQQLIDGGAAVDLNIAAGLGDLAEVKRRLRVRSQFVNRIDFKGRTPLSYAAANGHSDVMMYLIENGAAVVIGKDDQPNPIARSLGAGGYQRESALESAVRRGQAKVVKQLLDAGADPNSGSPPLIHITTNENLLDVVRVLLAHKDTDADALGGDEETALHKAARLGRTEIAKALISAGAEVNRKSGERTDLGCLPSSPLDVGPLELTPLHLAAKSGKVEIVKLLIRHGAKVNMQERDGKSPLDLSEGKTTELIKAAGGKSGLPKDKEKAKTK